MLQPNYQQPIIKKNKIIYLRFKAFFEQYFKQQRTVQQGSGVRFLVLVLTPKTEKFKQRQHQWIEHNIPK